MAEGWSSDWEILFAKCVADQHYRTQLLNALDQGIDNTVLGLLDTIGIGGAATEQRSARLNALKAARGPMGAAARAFGDDIEALAAP